MAETPKASSAAVAAGPPPAPGTAGARRPLGVPVDYVAPGGPIGRPADLAGFMGPVAMPVGVAPRFFEEHLLTPIGMPAEKIAQLQRRLDAAGLIGKRKYVLGVWDAVSQDAYRQVLETANAYGVDEMQALAIYERGQAMNETVDRPTVQLTHPTDIRSQVTDRMRRKYGHGAIDRTVVEDIVNEYRALEQAAQESTASTVTAPPDLTTFVDEELQRAAPEEVGMNDALHGANLVMRAFTGGGAGA